MRFLAVGECMVEMSHAGEGLWRQGFAGDTLNTAWYMRAGLPADWAVEYFTVVGTDPLSEATVALQQLGYKPAEAQRMARQAHADGDAAETIIRKALQSALR